MNDEELNELLANIAAHDSRTWTPEQIDNWRTVMEPIPYAWAHRAFVEHIASSTEYLMPAHIAGGARRLWKAHRSDSSEIQRRAIERATFEREQTRAAASAEQTLRYGAGLMAHVWKAVNAAPRRPAGGPVLTGAGIKAGMRALDEYRAQHGRSPYSGPSRLIPCGRTGCVCTHDGCERGFVIIEQPDGSDQVAFCKTCNPQREHLVNQGQGDRMAAQRMLRENRPEQQGAGLSGGNEW